MSEPPGRVRIDKWLWAARFFKTRALAQAAVVAGKVRLHDERIKPSKDVRAGDVLGIESDQVQQLLHPGQFPSFGDDPVYPQRGAHDGTHGVPRVQRRERVLENHLELAPVRAQFLLR